MKKITTLIISAIVFTMTLSATVSASDDINVTIDGSILRFDQPPVISSGRTLVPMRAILEALGATVEWDADTKSIMATKDDVAALLTVGNSTMTYGVIGGEAKDIALDTPPEIVNGRTMIPARAVSEAFGFNVNWDAKTKTVIITTEDTSQPSTPEPVTEATTTKAVEVNQSATDNRIYSNPGTNDSSLAYSNIFSAIYDGDTLYFNFRGNKLYTYNGTSVLSFDTDCFPKNIIARNGQAYYFGDGSSKDAIYHLDTNTGEYEALFNENGEIDVQDIKLYRDYIIVTSPGKIYGVNVNSRESSLLYQYEGGTKANTDATAADGKIFIRNNPQYTNGKQPDTIIQVDPATGISQEVYSGDYLYDLFCAADGSGVYFYEKTEDGSTYYFYNPSTGKCEAISSSEYKNAGTVSDKVNDSCWYDGGYIQSFGEGTIAGVGTLPQGITLMNRDTYKKEVLHRGKGILYVTNNQQNIVFIQSENGFGDGFSSSAAVCIMNIDGSNVREIMNNNRGYASSANDSNSSSGNTVCNTCGGDGMVTCHICHGSGRGPNMLYLGEVLPQGCTTCGQTGEVLCSDCNGSGRV